MLGFLLLLLYNYCLLLWSCSWAISEFNDANFLSSFWSRLGRVCWICWVIWDIVLFLCFLLEGTKSYEIKEVPEHSTKEFVFRLSLQKFIILGNFIFFMHIFLNNVPCFLYAIAFSFKRLYVIWEASQLYCLKKRQEHTKPKDNLFVFLCHYINIQINI